MTILRIIRTFINLTTLVRGAYAVHQVILIIIKRGDLSPLRVSLKFTRFFMATCIWATWWNFFKHSLTGCNMFVRSWCDLSEPNFCSSVFFWGLLYLPRWNRFSSEIETLVSFSFNRFCFFSFHTKQHFQKMAFQIIRFIMPTRIFFKFVHIALNFNWTVLIM